MPAAKKQGKEDVALAIRVPKTMNRELQQVALDEESTVQALVRSAIQTELARRATLLRAPGGLEANCRARNAARHNRRWAVRNQPLDRRRAAALFPFEGPVKAHRRSHNSTELCSAACAAMSGRLFIVNGRSARTDLSIKEGHEVVRHQLGVGGSGR